jgi:hypothetical protein
VVGIGVCLASPFKRGRVCILPGLHGGAFSNASNRFPRRQASIASSGGIPP